MAGGGCEMKAQNEQEQRTLWVVLWINALMFVFELLLGLWAHSTGLIADSLDMLADASVYGIGLYAIGRRVVWQVRAARVAGLVEVVLAILVLLEVARKWLYGSEPVGGLMMAVGLVALCANYYCLTRIAQHKQGGVHMRASYIFSKNDVIANAGVILAGLLVWATGSRYPDLVIGLAIALLVLRGGWTILKDAQVESASGSCASDGGSQ